jgi:glycosyltransferase involved in cell wall biosynthesis
MIRVALSTSVMQRGRSGVASYIFGLLEGLRAIEAPVELILIGLEEDRSLFARWLDRCAWEPVAERWRPAVRNIAWHQTALRALLRRCRADVLHIPSYRRVVWRPPVPQVVTIHDLAAFAVSGKYDPARMFYGRRVVAPMARAADRVAAVSHTTAQDIQRYFRVPADRLEVVWNGIDHAAYFPRSWPESRQAIADRFGLDAPYFLYLARLEHPAKNHVRLIEAFERFVSANPARQEHLVFGGADWHGADVIHARVERSPCRERIRNLGFVASADLPLWYGAATAMVYPSLFEGFGLPPIEAMACGTPVISSTRGSLGEVVGNAARLIDPENVPEIAAALGEITPGERELWGRRGIAHAAQFRWEHTARAMADIYLRAAGAAPLAGVNTLAAAETRRPSGQWASASTQ